MTLKRKEREERLLPSSSEKASAKAFLAPSLSAPSKKVEASSREAAERARAEALLAKRRPASSSVTATPATDRDTEHAWRDSDQFNREDVRAAHERERQQDRQWHEEARQREREVEEERRRLEDKEGALRASLASRRQSHGEAGEGGRDSTQGASDSLATANDAQTVNDQLCVGQSKANEGPIAIIPASQGETNGASPESAIDVDDDQRDAAGRSFASFLRPPKPHRAVSGASTSSASSASFHGRLDTPSSNESDAEVVQRYRESMYPTLLGEMIDIVLSEESYLFVEPELALLRRYKSMSYEARYLLSRLIQRKDGWIRFSKLDYSSDVKDTDAAVAELCQHITASEDERPPEGESAFTQFVMSESDMDTDLEPLLNMLNLEELKMLAKNMQRLSTAMKTKAKIIESLLGSKSQGLPGFGKTTPRKQEPAKAPESSSAKKPVQTTLSFGGKATIPKALASPSPRKTGSSKNQEAFLRAKLSELVGKCVRLDPLARKLLDRVALIYYRGNLIQGASALTTAVLARSRKRNYPVYNYARTPRLWPSREHLLNYERALEREVKMEELLEWDGSKEAIEKAWQLFEEVWGEWKAAVAECEENLPEGVDRLTYHRMRFHAGWVITRIIYKGMYCLGRFKMYEREKEVLNSLLSQRVFRLGKRGDWYDRLALILMQYSENKTAGRKQALEMCMRGLQDPNTHLIYHDALQRRIRRLESALRVPFSEQHDFSYAKLQKSTEVTFYGTRLDAMLDDRTKLDLFGRPIVTGTVATPDTSSESIALVQENESPSKNFVERRQLKKTIRVERRVSDGRSPSPVKSASAPAAPGDSFETSRKETRISMASVWRGLDGAPCRVEALSLQHYALDGFKG